jgi:hypothetical protein
MLTCLPESFCSWNYRVLGAHGGAASLQFNLWKEQGMITLGSDQFAIVKHGMFASHWTLERAAGEVIADARKTSTFSREFQITAKEDGASVTVKARSAFSRAFELLANGAVVGTVEPIHAMTRRATVNASDVVPELGQLFAFWLVALTWRRQAAAAAAAH